MAQGLYAVDAMTRPEAVEVALWHAALGFPVFPVALAWDARASKVTKRPLTPHGFLDGMTDHDEIVHAFMRARLGAGEEIGVGLWPGPAGYVVLDLDLGGLDAAVRALRDLDPDTMSVRVRTVSGGLHVYTRKAEGLGWVGNGAPTGIPGVDCVRADAGFVIAAGTRCSWGEWALEGGALVDAFTLPAEVGLDTGGARERGERRDLDDRDGEAVRILEGLGWHSTTYSRGGAVLLTRPGKDRGASAAVGVLDLHGSVYVYTTSDVRLSHGAHDLGELRRLAGARSPSGYGIKWAGTYDGDLEHDDDLELVAVRLADVERERVEWLWPWRIARGKLTVLDGDPNVGKSTLALHIAACCSAGLPIAGAGRWPAPVVLLSAEDGLGDTIRPRLEAAGANLANVHALTGLRRRGDEHERGLTLPSDADRVEAFVRDLGAVLVVVDVLAAYTVLEGKGADVHRDSDMRAGLLTRLAAFAERSRAALLLLRHLTKSHAGNALYAGAGSIAITAAARNVLTAHWHPDDPEGTENRRRVLAVAKSNLSPIAPSLEYRLESVPALEVARVEWLGESGLGANALLSSGGSSERSLPPAVETALGYLRAELGDGLEHAVKPLAAHLLESYGITRPTLYRAADELPNLVRSRAQSEQGRPATWRLP